LQVRNVLTFLIERDFAEFVPTKDWENRKWHWRRWICSSWTTF